MLHSKLFVQTVKFIMKITYIIFIITCLASHCFGEDETNGKPISSSYTYSIEYNDSDHGNFGHKIEVKDGSAKVNVRSENTNKYNTAVASSPGKPYLPDKKAVVYENPKEVSYAPATENSQVSSEQKSTQGYNVPQVSSKPQNTAAYNAALQKYSREQLSILLSQNKNPFLPLDPKDSINKFVSKYITPQPSHPPTQPQTNPVYVQQYQTQSYPATTDSKSQYPAAYYTPSVSQQTSQVQQAYYKPELQYSYPQPETYSNVQKNVPTYVPQKQTAPVSQGAVQYVYVPQNIPQTTSAHSAVLPQSVSYGGYHTGPVQFAQQSYQPSAGHQPGQVTYSVPNAASYPSYNPGQHQVPSLPSHYYTSQPAIQEKQQYATVPSSSTYQSYKPEFNAVPKTASPVANHVYQNVYGHQYPSTSVSSPQYGSNTVSYKQESQGPSQSSQGNFDYSKYVQYVPTNQQIPSVTYKPSETNSASNVAKYFSGIPSSNSNGHVPAVAYKPAETSFQPSSNIAQYYPGKSSSTAAQDASKLNVLQSYSTGHNLFAQLQSNPNYGSLFSGASQLKYEDASKYSTNSQPSQSSASAYGSNVVQATHNYPQFTNSAGPSTNYKPVVEYQNTAPDSKLQYQSSTGQTDLGSHNFDASKLQYYSTNVPNEHSFNLNQISNVQASDNKYGQYAIDFRQGTSPSGAAQVMVQTNYNLGAHNGQSTHGSAPASAASDNSNVQYVYVPSYPSPSGVADPIK